MTDTQPETTHEVTCPHCRRPFTATLLEGSAARHRGFKCPHCRLFVPFERVDGSANPQPAA